YFLGPAPGKETEKPDPGLDPKLGSSLLCGKAGSPVHERMAHVLGPEPQTFEEGLLEGEDHGQTVYRRGQPVSSFGVPGPELRRNVVQDLGAAPVSCLGHSQIEAGIVHQDDQVVPAGPKIVL